MSQAVPASDYVHMAVEEILLKPEITDLTRPHTKCKYTMCMIQLEQPTALGDLLWRGNAELIVPNDNKVVLPGNNNMTLRYFSHLMASCPYTRDDHIVRTDDVPIGIINVSIYRLFHLTVPFFEEVDTNRMVTHVYELFIGIYPDTTNLVYLQTALPQPDLSPDDAIALFADEDDLAQLDRDIQWAEPTGERVILDISGISPQSAAGQIEHYGIHWRMTSLDYMPYGNWQPITRRRRVSASSSSDSDDDEAPQRRRRRLSSASSSSLT